jgi:hypothetical protein
MAERKKKKTPEDEGAVRIDAASDKPRAGGVGGGPRWLNPKESLPKEITAETTAPKQTILDKALAVVPGVSPVGKTEGCVLAAVVIAQALDRLGEKMIQAAAVGRANIVVEQSKK